MLSKKNGWSLQKPTTGARIVVGGFLVGGCLVGG